MAEQANIVFSGRLFEVELRPVAIRGGQRNFEIIRHPGAAVILPVLADGRVVLIHNYREAVGRELIEAPAGTLDPGEAPEVCAARELAEETGYRAGRVTPLLAIYSTPGIMDERLHLFLATELTPGPTAHGPGEQIRVATMELSEALAGIGGGRIVDAKTIVALLYYARFVRGGAGGGA